ncbi:MAG: hypothetical protein ACEPOW_05095 [Bacteroidales bacterium]
MKKKKLELSFAKETISNLEKRNLKGGKLTFDCYWSTNQCLNLTQRPDCKTIEKNCVTIKCVSQKNPCVTQTENPTCSNMCGNITIR